MLKFSKYTKKILEPRPILNKLQRLTLKNDFNQCQCLDYSKSKLNNFDSENENRNNFSVFRSRK